MAYTFIIRLRRAAGWAVDSRPFAFADAGGKEAKRFEAASLRLGLRLGLELGLGLGLRLGLGLFLIHILDFRPSCSLVIVRHTYT